MRTIFLTTIVILASTCYSQNNICGDYVQPFYADDMWTKLTLKSDSTFEYYNVYLGEERRNGKWTMKKDTVILYNYRRVIRTSLTRYEKSIIIDNKLIPIDSTGQPSKWGHLVKKQGAENLPH